MNDEEIIDAIQLEDDLDELWLQRNPAPVGGRAALGAAAGLGLATIVAAAWCRLERDTWFINQISDRSIRLKYAGGQLALAPIGAVVMARPGTRLAAAIGTAIGVVAAQLPMLIDPGLVRQYPILGNIWQYSLPIGGAILGVNVVTR